MEWTNEKVQEVYELAMKKAMVDEEFRKSITENPHKAIEELSGMKIDEDITIRVIENDPNYQMTFILPEMLGEEISADDLDSVVGGSCGGNACAGNGCAGQITK